MSLVSFNLRKENEMKNFMYALMLLMPISSAAFAETKITSCQSYAGYGYYPFVNPISKNNSGWKEDKTTGGKTSLVMQESGKYDVIFADSMRPRVSATEDGGTVVLLRKSPKDIAVLVNYLMVAEIYTFWKTDDGQLQYSLVQSKGGTISKTGAYVGTCDLINL